MTKSINMIKLKFWNINASGAVRLMTPQSLIESAFDQIWNYELLGLYDFLYKRTIVYKNGKWKRPASSTRALCIRQHPQITYYGGG